jgi:hypothetical protein
VVVAALAVSALASAACASRTVNQVLADPSRYRDREVRLSGAVVDSYSFVNRGADRIDDMFKTALTCRVTRRRLCT